MRRIAGLERQRAGEMRLRLLGSPGGAQHQPGIVEGDEVPGIELQQPVIGGERAVDVAPLAQQLGKQPVRRHIVGAQGERPSAQRLGARHVLGAPEGDRQVAVRGRRIGVELEDLREQVGGDRIVLGVEARAGARGEAGDLGTARRRRRRGAIDLRRGVGEDRETGLARGQSDVVVCERGVARRIRRVLRRRDVSRLGRLGALRQHRVAPSAAAGRHSSVVYIGVAASVAAKPSRA